MASVRVALDWRPALLGSSGIGRAVRELSRALAVRTDLQLHLFAHSLAPAARPETPPPGARLHRWPIPGRSLPLLAKLGLPAARLAGGAQVFHWTDYVHPPIGGTAHAVLTIHDLAFADDQDFHGDNSAVLLERTRRAAERARLVVTPTQATADAVVAHLAVDPARVRVIPFGADHIPRRDAEPGSPFPERPYVLVLGTIEPRKNHLALLRAWEHVPDPKPSLVVIGRVGWQCAPIVTALEEAAQRKELVWYRDCDDAQVFRHLRHAAALVYPSLLEGFGFPPLEAMAMGTPVVAADVPALREVLDDAASYCDPNDPLSIAQALNETLRHRGLRAHLRERGLRRAASFTWDHAAAAHAAVYKEAMA